MAFSKLRTDNKRSEIGKAWPLVRILVFISDDAGILDWASSDCIYPLEGVPSEFCIFQCCPVQLATEQESLPYESLGIAGSMVFHRLTFSHIRKKITTDHTKGVDALKSAANCGKDLSKTFMLFLKCLLC